MIHKLLFFFCICVTTNSIRVVRQLKLPRRDRLFSMNIIKEEAGLTVYTH